MLPSVILSLREGLEAALIIGIVLGALNKIHRPDLRFSVLYGTLSAFGVSLLTAIGLNLLGAEFEGQGEAIFEGITLLLAAGLLTWMIVWMGRQARTLKGNLESGVQQAALQTGASALFLLAFFSITKEGIELAVFLYAARLASTAVSTYTGAVLGLCIAGGFGWLLFHSTRRLSLQRFFQVTNILLILFAAGLVSHAVHAFGEVGWVSPIVSPLWNLNPILNENSIPGQILHTLFGYSGSPSLSEVMAYTGYFLASILLLKITLSPKATQTKAA